MPHTNQETTLSLDENSNVYRCAGVWSILTVDALTTQLETMEWPKAQTITLDGEGLTYFDSAAAIFLLHFSESLAQHGNHIQLSAFTAQHLELYHLVESKKSALKYKPPTPDKHGILYRVGEESAHKLEQGHGLLILVGDLSDKLARACFHWRKFQFPSIVSNIYHTGISALPIIGLLSFLIGVVLAYQMGLQLETYGANIFIAYLSGTAIFREFAPLITSIIVAGRTSSSFTAQIGSMKINEEIDALYTMGLSPTELLVVPKILALLLVFPLLIFWANFFSILGAMYMSKVLLHVGYYDFLARIRDSVGITPLLLGIYKAPAFAILIGLVGCFQGFRVQANAESLGQQTTKSVVQALFLIIIADATYSVIYSWLGL